MSDIPPQYPHFTPLDIRYMDMFEVALGALEPLNSEFSFGYLFAWRKPLNLEFCLFEKKFIAIRGELNGEKFFFPPLNLDFPSENDRAGWYEASLVSIFKIGAQRIICADNILASVAVNSSGKNIPEVSVSPQREFFDYVYSAGELSALKGDRYQSKRNFVNRFNKKYGDNFRYQILDGTKEGKEMVSRCILLHDKWNKMKLTDVGKSSVPSFFAASLEDEDIAARELLENFYQLKLCGCALLAGEEVAAFSIGEHLNKDTVVVHIEKADPGFVGSYQMMVKLGAATIKDMGYKYINKEEDLGIPNLRKTKTSYHPLRLVEKYEIRMKHI